MGKKRIQVSYRDKLTGRFISKQTASERKYRNVSKIKIDITRINEKLIEIVPQEVTKDYKYKDKSGRIRTEKKKYQNRKYKYKGKELSGKKLEKYFKQIKKKQQKELKKVNKKPNLKQKDGYKLYEYETPELRIDRKDDIDFSSFVTEFFERYILPKHPNYIEYMFDVFVRVNQGELIGKPVKDSGFFEDSFEGENSLYYSVLNSIMKILRDYGMYMEKSEWRYKKRKTKKSKAESVFAKAIITVIE